MSKRLPDRDRGQAHTLEGVLSAMLVLTSLLYGLQVVDIGARTTDQSGQSATLRSQASDVLAVAADNNTLQTAVRCYGNDHPTITGDRNVTNASRFEYLLNQTLDENLRDYKLYFEYWNESNGRERLLVSSNATEAEVSAPSARAVEVSRTVTLYDTMNATEGNTCTDSGTTLADQDLYADDVAPDSIVYNVVEVRLVVW